ncbi:MAG: nucleotidyltransferase [Thermoprotei archaeon]|nr:MAG: nucleotidyltransferase [Thermoprotei archaeon]
MQVRAVIIVGYSKSTFALAINKLRSHGIDGVIIGSTVIMLRIGVKELEDDIDLFTTSVSPIFDEDLIRDVANTLGCFIGQTEWGTPQLRCVLNSDEVVIELYENMYDFYIPQQMIREAVSIRIEGVNIRLLKPGDYIILKAKAGREKDIEDLRAIAGLIKSSKVRISMELVKDHLKLFEEYEAKLIRKRLKECGFKL